MIKRSPFYALSLLVWLGLIWGSGYSIARYATTNGVTPLGYAFWQSLGPAIALFALHYFLKIKFPINRTLLMFYFVCGFFGIAFPNTIMYFAAPHLPAGLLALIVNTVPIFIYPIALIFKQEKFATHRLLGVLIGLLGIFSLILPQTQIPQSTQLPWILITLVTPLSFALCAIYISCKQPADIHPLSVSAGMLGVSTLLLFPVVMQQHDFYYLTLHTLPSLAVILEIVLSSIGYVLFFKLIKSAGPVYYSLVGGVVAITGLTWGRILFQEELTLFNMLATICILSGIGIITLNKNASLENYHE